MLWQFKCQYVKSLTNNLINIPVLPDMYKTSTSFRCLYQIRPTLIIVDLYFHFLFVPSIINFEVRSSLKCFPLVGVIGRKPAGVHSHNYIHGWYFWTFTWVLYLRDFFSSLWFTLQLWICDWGVESFMWLSNLFYFKWSSNSGRIIRR